MTWVLGSTHDVSYTRSCCNNIHISLGFTPPLEKRTSQCSRIALWLYLPVSYTEARCLEAKSKVAWAGHLCKVTIGTSRKSTYRYTKVPWRSGHCAYVGYVCARTRFFNSILCDFPINVPYICHLIETKKLTGVHSGASVKHVCLSRGEGVCPKQTHVLKLQLKQAKFADRWGGEV